MAKNNILCSKPKVNNLCQQYILALWIPQQVYKLTGNINYDNYLSYIIELIKLFILQNIWQSYLFYLWEITIILQLYYINKSPYILQTHGKTIYSIGIKDTSPRVQWHGPTKIVHPTCQISANEAHVCD